VEITEVRIKLMEDAQERLQAFCSITFDHCFVIRDLKIIEGARGSFVAMPSRKLTDRCPRCSTKNSLRACYCSQCGAKLQEERAGKDSEGRSRLYADIAHPINARCREQIQARVMQAFAEEQVKARQPGYVCNYDDFGEDNYAILDEPAVRAAASTVELNGHVLRRDRPIHSNGSPLSGPHFAANGHDRGNNGVSAGMLRGAERFSEGDDGFGMGVE